jgi:hypothetical protein
MARARNPFSNRNQSAKFTGAEVAAYVAKHGDLTTLAASKRARIVRERGEFDSRALAQLLRAPIVSSGAYSWSLEQIVAARDAQMAGRFALPARLAESFNTDDALFTARSVRLAPVQSLGVKIAEGRGPKSDKIADEADALFGAKGIALSSDTENSIRSCLVDHGVAFGAISWTARADGSRIDPVLNAWPIEFVWWDAVANCYVTQVRRPLSDPEPTPRNLFGGAGAIGPGSMIEPILHGNGRWVVFTKSEILPHRSADATLLPAALVWPCHAFANRDRRKGSASHGNAKVVGELPENVAATDEHGEPTDEAEAFMELLAAIASQDSPYGLKPSGSKVEILANPSNMWQVFSELAKDAEKAAARIYLGTDGVLGAQGGAPGVDISELFGVATSKVQSDLACIQRGSQSGLIDVWAAVNFGDSKAAPSREYVFPDPDESRVREDFAKRNAAFNADVAQYKNNGFVVDQPLIDRLAELHGVPAPKLPAQPGAPATGTAPANDVAASRGHLVARMPAMRRA